MRRTYRKEYEGLLPLVEKPGRYLGNERGSVRKDLGRVAVRVALAFPEVYEIAQSHLGLQILYDVLNRRDDVAAERAYAPWPDLERELRRRDLPLVSLESHLALRDFDVVGFSLQYELTYTNLLTMLELGGIPLRTADRGPADPIVVVGGPCAFNPEPLAPFVDAVVLGDGEEAIGDVVDVVKAWDRRDRTVAHRGLAAVAGVYVPSFFTPEYGGDGRLVAVRAQPGMPDRVAKRVLPDLDASPIPTAPIVPNLGIVHDRAAVEVMRGCVKGCRFCQAGYVYRPLRERDPSDVVARTTELLARTGYEEVSLLSLSTGDYSGVNPVLKSLMDRLVPERVAVSLPSTRVDALSPRILEEIRRVRKTGFTLAPEAGTQRLRDVIQKEYSEAELLDAARLFADLGWRTLKLYFMIGLPSETEDDVRGIAVLAERVKQAARGRLRVTASVSTFSPKPHTPFQWAAELDVGQTEARQALLRDELARRGVAFRWHDPRLTWLEGVFARGDRRLAPVLEIAQRLGARFDGWSDRARLDLWRRAFDDHGVDPTAYLRRRSLDEVLPWDHIDAGVSKKGLARELALAVEGTLTPDCSIERCTYCGACDFERLRNVDYHPEGAKGAEHRGTRISRWAETIVRDEPGADPTLPEWETRTWRKLRAEVRAGRRTGRATRRQPVETPLPTAVATPRTLAPTPRGQGTAEEWLGAVRSALEPAREAPPAVQRIRLHYRKLAEARFIGTRELGPVFVRAARRAALPIAFTQGFHPMPRLSFGPALPLGATSDHELVDVELTDRLPPQEAVRRLRAELPVGLVPVAAWEIDRALPSIDASLESILWDLDFGALAAPVEPDALRREVARLLAAGTFPVERMVKGRPRVIDARPLVRAATVTDTGRLRLAIRVGAGGSIKPSLLAGRLFGVPPAEQPLIGVHKAGASFRARPDAAAVLGA
jgi:radical SAM family uncharacterized protein/radical SAM-linked protein